ncbi:HAD hydrolase-like protein [Saccharothrix longispora]|uniref:HAD hydrolase-like protein n=1 Tax=Saccharothrix longispora TaxID=33920 RepID=UPI0028FD94A6|nr:HAD hydrolase-like protein [Saccharothrix longispora]MBY8848491.1 HAD hydrolase-like protein [Saccharothrix sp. MB29]MDU0287623.1 HAD hydrolase-like protein [Saccharothrix longispora]
MDAGELLAERDHVLVALDGPVAEGLSAHPVADRLRALVAEDRLPRGVARTTDPFAVLAHAAAIGPATERAVHAQWRRVEHEVVAGARVAPGVREAFAALVARGVRLTVVGALDVEVVRAFLVLHGLDTHVRRLVGRVRSDRAAPDLVASAVHAGAVPARSCAFVGGTDADLAAARAAGVDAFRHRPAAAPEPVTGADAWFGALSATRPTWPRTRG